MTNTTNTKRRNRIEQTEPDASSSGDHLTHGLKLAALARKGRKFTNAPLYKERRGRLEMAIWTRQDKNGAVHFSVSLTRSYKSKDGFRSTRALDSQDLLDAIELLAAARAMLPRPSNEKITIRLLRL